MTGLAFASAADPAVIEVAVGVVAEVAVAVAVVVAVVATTVVAMVVLTELMTSPLRDDCVSMVDVAVGIDVVAFASVPAPAWFGGIPVVCKLVPVVVSVLFASDSGDSRCGRRVDQHTKMPEMRVAS
jgi:hypothetical protein